MYSLNDQIEVAPGRFKRVAECRLADMEGAYGVSAEACELCARIVSLLKADRQRGLTARLIPGDLKARLDRDPGTMNLLELRQLAADLEAASAATKPNTPGS